MRFRLLTEADVKQVLTLDDLIETMASALQRFSTGCVTQPVRVLNSFFLVRPVRRQGFGLRAVREVVAQHPGRWDVAFQENNATAVRFWRRVAASVSGDAWSEEKRPIPGDPDSPPDVWISF